MKIEINTKTKTLKIGDCAVEELMGLLLNIKSAISDFDSYTIETIVVYQEVIRDPHVPYPMYPPQSPIWVDPIYVPSEPYRYDVPHVGDPTPGTEPYIVSCGETNIIMSYNNPDGSVTYSFNLTGKDIQQQIEDFLKTLKND